MKYKERDEIVASLRKLVDFLEDDKSLALPVPYIGISTYVNEYDKDGELDVVKSAAVLRRYARELGSCKKRWDDSYLRVVKMFGREIKWTFNVTRETICSKVVTGTKIVPSYYSPEKEVEVVEWVCEDVSLLATSER